MRSILPLLLIAVVAFMSLQTTQAQKMKEWFKDSTDNALDISGFLNSRVGFMPVPIVITEPAVGFGGGMGAVFFHNKKNFANKQTKGQLPPVMTMVGGAYTSNDSWFSFLAHQGSYFKDRFRYTGALGYMSINLTSYGTGIFGRERRFNFNMKGFLTFHELSIRPIRKVPMFVGFNYLYFNNQLSLKTGINIPGWDVITRSSNIGGMNMMFMWDTRDNMFTPNSGVMTAWEFGLFDKALGGDNNYWNFSNRTYAYVPFVENSLVGGFRANLLAKWGDIVPFYELPFITMRGIPALRYQDHYVGVGETEFRWAVYRRWSLIGFAGIGYTAPKIKEFNNSVGRVAGGGGFRYLIAKDYNIHGGIDVAKGPEQWAWYLTIGSNWFR